MSTLTQQGTITWFEIAKGELPPSETFGELGNYSATVIITDGKNVAITSYVRSPQEISVGWFGANNIHFEATHWAYINYPKPLTRG